MIRTLQLTSQAIKLGNGRSMTFPSYIIKKDNLREHLSLLKVNMNGKRIFKNRNHFFISKCVILQLDVSFFRSQKLSDIYYSMLLFLNRCLLTLLVGNVFTHGLLALHCICWGGGGLKRVTSKLQHFSNTNLCISQKKGQYQLILSFMNSQGE